MNIKTLYIHWPANKSIRLNKFFLKFGVTLVHLRNNHSPHIDRYLKRVELLLA